MCRGTVGQAASLIVSGNSISIEKNVALSNVDHPCIYTIAIMKCTNLYVTLYYKLLAVYSAIRIQYPIEIYLSCLVLLIGFC
jgi:hypothetical protein